MECLIFFCFGSVFHLLSSIFLIHQHQTKHICWILGLLVQTILHYKMSLFGMVLHGQFAEWRDPHRMWQLTWTPNREFCRKELAIFGRFKTHHILLWVHLFPFKRTNCFESWKMKSADNFIFERKESFGKSSTGLVNENDPPGPGPGDEEICPFFLWNPRIFIFTWTKMPFCKKNWANFIAKNKLPAGWEVSPPKMVVIGIRESPKSSKQSGLGVILGGGFKYFLFSPIPGETIQVDEHIFQMGWNHQLVQV